MDQNNSKIYLEILNKNQLRLYSPSTVQSGLPEFNSAQSLPDQLEILQHWLKENSNVQLQILFQPLCFSLVPNTLFDAANAPLYLDLLHSDLENAFISYESLEFASIELVYALPKNTVQTVQQKFEKANWECRHTALLKWISKESKSNANKGMWILSESDQLCLALFNAGRLLFFNAFKTTTWQDQLYYCMAIVEQQSINPKECQLNILGQDTPTELSKTLRQQFTSVNAYPSLISEGEKMGPIHLESSYLCA